MQLYSFSLESVPHLAFQSWPEVDLVEFQTTNEELDLLVKEEVTDFQCLRCLSCMTSLALNLMKPAYYNTQFRAKWAVNWKRNG